MTFKERYNRETTWYGRVLVMEIYHIAMSSRSTSWNLAKTAEHFECSIGLVSENLRLANLINTNEAILKCESRQEALKHLNGIKRRFTNGSDMETSIDGSSEKLD